MEIYERLFSWNYPPHVLAAGEYRAPDATNPGAYALNPTFPSLSNINLYACRHRLFLIGSHQACGRPDLLVTISRLKIGESSAASARGCPEGALTVAGPR